MKITIENSKEESSITPVDGRFYLIQDKWFPDLNIKPMIYFYKEQCGFDDYIVRKAIYNIENNSWDVFNANSNRYKILQEVKEVIFKL